MSVGIWVVTTGVRDRGWGSYGTCYKGSMQDSPHNKAPNVSSADKPCFVLKITPGAGGWIAHPIQELYEGTEGEGTEQPFSPTKGCFSKQP